MDDRFPPIADLGWGGHRMPMKRPVHHWVIALGAALAIATVTILALGLTPIGDGALLIYGCMAQGICI